MMPVPCTGTNIFRNQPWKMAFSTPSNLCDDTTHDSCIPSLNRRPSSPREDQRSADKILSASSMASIGGRGSGTCSPRGNGGLDGNLNSFILFLNFRILMNSSKSMICCSKSSPPVGPARAASTFFSILPVPLLAGFFELTCACAFPVTLCKSVRPSNSTLYSLLSMRITPCQAKYLGSKRPRNLIEVGPSGLWIKLMSAMSLSKTLIIARWA
mmetsp:Transcript_83857/g.224333  ORF Transcript_83857/g.224333 Transcript_83857/m.224333 type:complete len:213 (+) Transcript_83857:1861-2499(+)